jgi:transcriptional regulator with XRE-family HTH domain
MHTMLNIFSGLGPALRRLREKVAGLTQIQVAERTGISQGRLSRYENGRKIPDLITLDRLLTCYGADLEWLSRALKEIQGAPPSVSASDPELMVRLRAALVELGYSQPSPEPKT